MQSQASAFTDCLMTIEPDECSEEVRCFCNLDDNLLDNDLYLFLIICLDTGA